jgi:hypothetical protein
MEALGFQMLEEALADHSRPGWTAPVCPPTPHARMSGASPPLPMKQATSPTCVSQTPSPTTNLPRGTQAIICGSVFCANSINSP